MGQKAVVEHVQDPNEFDLRTHRYDPKTKQTIKNTYRAYLSKDGGELFERPVGSGNLWYRNAQPAGRVEFIDGKREFKIGTPHIEYTPPLSGAEKLDFDLQKRTAENAQLRDELKAIQAKMDALMAQMPKPGKKDEK